jgi:small subunit ribosomal protein S11
MADLEALMGGAGRSPNNTNSGSNRRTGGYREQGGFSSRMNSATQRAPTSFSDALDQTQSEAQLSFLTEQRNLGGSGDEKPHRLHVYATKHNTHLTFVQPPRPASQTASSGISSTNASAADQKKMVDVLLSLSAGNIGFRKAGRGSYDAAYQLTAFTLKQIQEKGMLRDIKKLEVVMRGFGAGREAVTKVLLGSEGRMIRDRISAVQDATRLKIGGTRSPKPRRLG